MTHYFYLPIHLLGSQRALREGPGGEADPAGRGDGVPVPARGQEGVRGGQGPRGALPQEGAAARPGDQGEVSVDLFSLEQSFITPFLLKAERQGRGGVGPAGGAGGRQAEPGDRPEGQDGGPRHRPRPAEDDREVVRPQPQAQPHQDPAGVRGKAKLLRSIPLKGRPIMMP